MRHTASAKESKEEGMIMDWSPILISMRTAGLSIVFTFFMGILAAWMVVRISHPLVKTILDGFFWSISA